MSAVERRAIPPAPGDPRANGTEALGDAVRELHAAQRRLRGRDQVAVGDGGAEHLTHAQVLVLVRLRDDGGRSTAGELARGAEVSPAALSTMLDGLETRGIVRRERSGTDRRVVEVSMTPEGDALLDRKHARWRARWEAGLADVDDDDLRVAARVVRRVARLYDEF